ncbi:antitoxin VbhA family protein [Mesobacillus selenatarsenatis]|uniref:Antitoxin VbhA family protein n=1 Tax=Mesobacillus selenatarsenatis TaxID=388741 RepID=A0A846TZP8_9BACI|nr:antitoxin VbhA family protein [Mesobacillus selenatarsenatis]NKE07076.1 antitoxin VbhA family protein [Mesobacillus selenatarsenatis]
MADEIEKAMKNAKASLELSGFKVEDYHTELVRMLLTGEMTNEEFLKEAKRLAQEKGGDSK